MVSRASTLRRDDVASDVSKDFSDHVVAQRYAEYTASAHEVWSEVLARNASIVSQYADRIHPAYREGLRALDLPRQVPHVEEINERLQSTGWKTVCVDGYIPTSVYVRLMANSVFPVSRMIRNPEHIDFAPMPDMVHDILGHLPMLFFREHRDHLKRLASVMTRAVPNELDGELFRANRHMAELKSDLQAQYLNVIKAEREVQHVHRLLEAKASELTRLGRLYLWTVEFGLIGTAQDFRAYGAALLSAPDELEAVCSGRASVLPHGPKVFETDISFSDLQKQYFVANDFEHLERVLTTYEDTMEFRKLAPQTRDMQMGERTTAGGLHA